MDSEHQKPGTLGYVFASLSFVPAIGLLIGLIVCVRGVFSKKPSAKTLMRIGLAGIGFNVVLYSTLFYFGAVKRGGVYDDLRTRMASIHLTTLVQAIEFYKIRNGSYPQTLQALHSSLPKDSLVFVFDPTDVKLNGQPRYFHYELIDPQHYYLRGVGPDGVAFTSDDIVPNLGTPPGNNLGLVIERVKP